MANTIILKTADNRFVKRECPVCNGHSLVANKGGDIFNCKRCGNATRRDDLPDAVLQTPDNNK